MPCVFRRQHLQPYTAPAHRHTQHQTQAVKLFYPRKRAGEGIICTKEGQEGLLLLYYTSVWGSLQKFTVGNSSSCIGCISQPWVQLQQQSSAPGAPWYSVPLSQHPAWPGKQPRA